MTRAKWEFEGREFNNCNCAYGCPCQFNALPTHGHCRAVVGIQIDSGYHGDTRLDGLRVAGIFAGPGPFTWAMARRCLSWTSAPTRPSATPCCAS